LQAEIRREQAAPDSLVVTPYVGGVAAGPDLRYAGVAGTVNGVGAANLWEHADEVRVFGSLLTPAITTASAAIRRVSLAVRQYYGDTTFTEHPAAGRGRDGADRHGGDPARRRLAAGRAGAAGDGAVCRR